MVVPMRTMTKSGTKLTQVLHFNYSVSCPLCKVTKRLKKMFVIVAIGRKFHVRSHETCSPYNSSASSLVVCLQCLTTERGALLVTNHPLGFRSILPQFDDQFCRDVDSVVRCFLAGVYGVFLTLITRDSLVYNSVVL